MLINLLVFIVLLALTVGAGWLTYRAIRGKRLWVKLAGGLGAGLLTLVLGAVTFAGGSGFLALYFPGAAPAPDLQVADTPEQIARGEYLANIACVGCHGAWDANGVPATLPLSGGYDLAAEEGFGFVGQMASENLTPAGKLAGYTDGEIFRVLRRGVSQDGHTLAFMSTLPYREMSDDDLQALVAYLRSQPPTTTTGPTGDSLNFAGLIFVGAGLFAIPAPIEGVITAPPLGPTAEYGRYVATFGECRGCHGTDMMGTPASAVSPAIPNPRPMVAAWTFEEFVQTMRTGVRPGGAAFADLMPWENASKMTDDDLAALYAYLTAATE